MKHGVLYNIFYLNDVIFEKEKVKWAKIWKEEKKELCYRLQLCTGKK